MRAYTCITSHLSRGKKIKRSIPLGATTKLNPQSLWIKIIVIIQPCIENQLKVLNNPLEDTRISDQIKGGIQNKLSERRDFLDLAQKELNNWRLKFRK